MKAGLRLTKGAKIFFVPVVLIRVRFASSYGRTLGKFVKRVGVLRAHRGLVADAAVATDHAVTPARPIGCGGFPRAIVLPAPSKAFLQRAAVQVKRNGSPVFGHTAGFLGWRFLWCRWAERVFGFCFLNGFGSAARRVAIRCWA